MKKGGEYISMMKKSKMLDAIAKANGYENKSGLLMDYNFIPTVMTPKHKKIEIISLIVKHLTWILLFTSFSEYLPFHIGIFNLIKIIPSWHITGNRTRLKNQRILTVIRRAHTIAICNKVNQAPSKKTS